MVKAMIFIVGERFEGKREENIPLKLMISKKLGRGDFNRFR